MKIQALCPHCKKWISNEFAFPSSEFRCPQCQNDLFLFKTDSFVTGKKLEQCPSCGASHLYRRKDFNQKTGIALVALGVALAYFTYGISLLMVTLIDFFLFRKIKEMGTCYQCKLEIRQSELIKTLEPFNLQILDYYKNLKP